MQMNTSRVSTSWDLLRVASPTNDDNKASPSSSPRAGIALPIRRKSNMAFAAFSQAIEPVMPPPVFNDAENEAVNHLRKAIDAPSVAEVKKLVLEGIIANNM